MDWLSPLREVSGFIFPFLESVPVLRAVLGFILVFFLPGFCWTLVFFGKIGVIERLAFSFALSIAFVTLSLVFLNRIIGLGITGFNSTLVIVTVTILPVIIYYLNGLVRRRKESND